MRRRVTDICVHETGDPEAIVAEFQYEGIVAETGEAFKLPGIFVMRVRDGKIVSSRELSRPYRVGPGSWATR